MPGFPRLTEMAHSLVSLWLRPGDFAIDATAGNGHDTCMLARLVGHTGHVLAIDIEPAGLEATRLKLLDEEILDARVSLVTGNHDSLEKLVPADWFGRVRVIMFNLGYRPHAEAPIATRLISTLTALGQCLGLLADGGLLTLVLYRAHDGAEQETQAIMEWAFHLDDRLWHVARYDLPNIRSRPPVLIAISRRKRRSPASPEFTSPDN
ncbi:MAG: class I SAM-dependent methyltransferase [bacterium]